VIDPSCGSGGFLIIALEHMWSKIEIQGKKKKWDRDTITRKKKDLASKFIQGIDKDSFLAKVTKAYMAIIGDGRGGIFSENSLHNPNDWNENAQSKITLGKYDLLFTNPPFGAKIPIRGDRILSQYHLAKKWSFDKKTEVWTEGGKYADKRPPQILFVERCLQFLREGGRMAIVLPDSIVGNSSDGYIRDFILTNAKLLAVVDCPIDTFANHTKTSVLIIEKKSDKDKKKYPIFMAIAKKCGHDKRGKEIFKLNSKGVKISDDDFPEIVEAYKKFKRENK
jgi:type I restriction enzyme M protein